MQDDGQYVYIGRLNPNATEYYGKSSFVELIKAYEEIDTLVNLANSNLQIENTGKFTPEEARGVAQRELVMANLDSQKPILGTFGADSCVAIAVYNPTTHKAMLSHVDALTELSSLRRYLDIIAQDSTEKLQVHLAGGQESSKEVCAKIIKMLNDRGDNTIKSSKLIPLGGSGESLAIDARTGEVFTSFNPDQLDLGTDFDSKNQLLGLQTSTSPIKFVDYEKEAVKDKESEGGLVAKLSTKLEQEKSDIEKEKEPEAVKDKESEGLKFLGLDISTLSALGNFLNQKKDEGLKFLELNIASAGENLCSRKPSKTVTNPELLPKNELTR